MTDELFYSVEVAIVASDGTPRQGQPTAVRYCDICRRWGMDGTRHICWRNWRRHLSDLLLEANGPQAAAIRSLMERPSDETVIAGCYPVNDPDSAAPAPGKTAGEAEKTSREMAHGVAGGRCHTDSVGGMVHSSACNAVTHLVDRLRAELAEAREDFARASNDASKLRDQLSDLHAARDQQLAAVRARAEKAEAALLEREIELGQAAIAKATVIERLAKATAALAASVRREDAERISRSYTDGIAKRCCVSVAQGIGDRIRDLTMDAGTGETTTADHSGCGHDDEAPCNAGRDVPPPSTCLPGCQDVGDYWDQREVSIVHANGCPNDSAAPAGKGTRP